MRFREIIAIPGPNVYSHRPVLAGILELGDFASRTTADLPGFTERLLSMLPSIGSHYCGLGYAGGFLERLREGTLLGHVLEHVAIELAQETGIGVNHGKTRETPEPGVYRIIVEYRSEAAMRELLEQALCLVQAAVENTVFNVESCINHARRTVERAELGPSTRTIVHAAEKYGIPWRRLNDNSLVQLGWGRNRKLIQASMTSATSCISVDIAADKQLTKRLLEEACVPVPHGGVAKNLEEAFHVFRRITPPVAVKPLNGNQGRGVTLHITGEDQLSQAVNAALKISPAVILEEMLEGSDFRILAINGRFAAASVREPPYVIGDGVSTIAQLIELENMRPERGRGHERPLTRIETDTALEATLGGQQLDLQSVPAQGRIVRLRHTANLSTGGSAADVTAQVHPEIQRICERAARTIGLDICGIDLITTHIDRPLGPKSGIIEINAAPGLRMHCYPSYGEPRDIGDIIIRSLYPRGKHARIPLIAVTGTNGKTTVTRLTGHVLAQDGKTVGMTTTDGIYIGGERIASGDMTGPQSALTVLSDPTVDCAVLETARGGILRRGLAFDWADVGVLTNIQLDHVGQDGIRDVEDLLWIKSLVAERVREGGSIVLNADDPLLARLPERPRVEADRKSVVFFSLDGANQVLREHLQRGGTGFWVREGWIVEGSGAEERWIVRISDMPITLNGTAEFQVANILAAVAACRSLGVASQTIASALRTFRSDRDNAGRANLFRLKTAYVMVDYGHNPAAFSAVCRMAGHWTGSRTTGIIGVPGDRDNSVIDEAARAAALGFDRIFIKEDADKRGRAEGEIAALLEKGVRAADATMDCRIVLDECSALMQVLDDLQPEELVIVFHEKLEPVVRLLAERGATPVSGFEARGSREPVMLWSDSAGEQRVPIFGD